MSKVFQYLYGELENKDGGTITVESVRGEGRVLAVYFSAHWCPPCRNFTPKLVQFYKKVKDSNNGNRFELVFVSSDKAKEAFSEYLSEMPWWALPFERRDDKANLSKLFKVRGIPTLLLLDGATGKVINRNGRAIVEADPAGQNFPWRAPTLHDILRKGEFINNSGEMKTFEQALKGKTLGIYFSAHWCPPCKAFTPNLCQLYQQVKSDGKAFEIIFVSSDSNEQAFNEYFNQMPFLAIPFDSEVKYELSELYEVEGIPTLIIADENGQVITPSGRAVVEGDLKGEKFPWRPAPVEELNEVSAAKLEDGPCLIYLPGGDEERFSMMREILTPLGLETVTIAKNEGANPDLYFLMAPTVPPEENNVVESLCEFIRVDAEKESLFILDIFSEEIYKFEKQEYTKEGLGKFVSDFRDGKLKAQPLGSES